MALTNDFDPEFNLDYHSKYDTQSNIVSNILGGGVAAVADFGTSVWNSLPGTEEVATEDVLRRVSDNALRVYEENPDLIQAISFIGGSFVPAGLALKGLSAARAGIKGVSWFSNAGKEASLLRVEEAFKTAGAASKEYRAAKNALYGRGLANQLLDAAVVEAAVVGTLNAHPFMEDYFAEPVKNAAISLALGGAIGAGLGRIADGALVRGVTGKVEQAAAKTVTDNISATFEGMQSAQKIQTEQINISNLQKMLDDAKAQLRTPENDITMSYAAKMLLQSRDAQHTTFMEMLSPELTDLATKNQDFKNTLMDTIAGTLKMSGVDSIKLLTQKEAPSTIMGKIKSALTENLNFPVKLKNSLDEAGNVVQVPSSLKEVAYYPEFGRFSTPGDAKHYARARDLGKSIEQIDKELGKQFGQLPRKDIAEELLTKNSASVDKEFIAALHRVDKMSPEQVTKLVISPDDLPMINAVIARAAKEPDLFENVTLTVTRNQPNFEVMEQAVYKAAGVKPTHSTDLKAATTPQAMQKYNLLGSVADISEEARSLLQGWRAGSGVLRMRNGADAFFRGGYGGTANAEGRLVGELYNSAQSKALRDVLRQNADAEGNIYLYRGMKGKAVGHASLESYTTDIEKAREFGRPALYKVHVDDVLGGILDLKSPDGIMKNEIIVGSPARQAVASLPVGTMTEAFATSINTVSNKATISEIGKRFVELKDELISSMLAQGMPMETIAIRTNTPVDTVKAFALAPNNLSVIELGRVAEYAQASEIGAYMDPAKRVLGLTSSFKKVQYGELKAGIDIKAAADINREIVRDSLNAMGGTTNSEVRDFLDTRAPLFDLIRAGISNFVNSKSGNKFIQSTDFYVRDMGDVGMMASTIGKDIQDLINKSIGRIVRPVSDKMAKLVGDEVALTEINTAVNLNASLKGWREYKDGQFWQMVERLDVNGNKVTVKEAVQFQGKPFKVAKESVDDLLKEIQTQGKELYKLKNAGNRIKGTNPINDIGFWVPSFNPKGKFISYLHDARDDTTKLIWGNTSAELASAENAIAATIPPDLLGSSVRIVRKSDQAAYNRLAGRQDSLTMDIADVSLQKTGASAGAIIKTTTDIFSEITGGYEHYLNSQIKHLVELDIADITDTLNRMSGYNQSFHAGQNLSAVGKFLDFSKDTANVIKNTLLGNSNLNEYGGWKLINQSFETGVSMGLQTVSKVWNTFTEGFRTVKAGGSRELDLDKMRKFDYEAFAKALEKEGVVNPFAAFDKEAARIYDLSKITDQKNTTSRLVHAGNALAATVALRVGELAQPIVNALSLPILSSLAIADKMPSHFMGIAQGTAKVSGAQIMYEGARAMNDPAFAALRTKWQNLGYMDALVSEATEAIKLTRGYDNSAITKVEKILDSNLINKLSIAADWSESFVRNMSMHNGAVLAKRLYPGLDDNGVTIFARDFMDRAMGNYHAAQRPVFFQGTLGVAMGLFQTYMLTLAQATYRHLELKNYKALGKAMLTQSGIFGTSSLPGFHPISELIGEHFSDNNVDLTTGTYRALGDTMADFMLYGLPSNLGPAFYTRGEIAPRMPGNPVTGLENLVGVNMVKQTFDMVNNVRKSLEAPYPDVARAFGEALSIQSMSRPVARMAELATGYSVTRKDNTVQSPEEVWSATGIISRVLSTRPLQETKLRQAIHLDSFYGTLDREARQEFTGRLKTAIRNGTLNEELLSELSEGYMRKGGSSQGWRSAVNTAIAQSTVSGKAALIEKLGPDNPLVYMVDNLD